MGNVGKTSTGHLAYCTAAEGERETVYEMDVDVVSGITGVIVVTVEVSANVEEMLKVRGRALVGVIVRVLLRSTLIDTVTDELLDALAAFA